MSSTSILVFRSLGRIKIFSIITIILFVVSMYPQVMNPLQPVETGSFQMTESNDREAVVSMKTSDQPDTSYPDNFLDEDRLTDLSVDRTKEITEFSLEPNSNPGEYHTINELVNCRNFNSPQSNLGMCEETYLGPLMLSEHQGALDMKTAWRKAFSTYMKYKTIEQVDKRGLESVLRSVSVGFYMSPSKETMTLGTVVHPGTNPSGDTKQMAPSWSVQTPYFFFYFIYQDKYDVREKVFRMAKQPFQVTSADVASLSDVTGVTVTKQTLEELFMKRDLPWYGNRNGFEWYVPEDWWSNTPGNEWPQDFPKDDINPGFPEWDWPNPVPSPVDDGRGNPRWPLPEKFPNGDIFPQDGSYPYPVIIPNKIILVPFTALDEMQPSGWETNSENIVSRTIEGIAYFTSGLGIDQAFALIEGLRYVTAKDSAIKVSDILWMPQAHEFVFFKQTPTTGGVDQVAVAVQHAYYSRNVIDYAKTHWDITATEVTSTTSAGGSTVWFDPTILIPVEEVEDIAYHDEFVFNQYTTVEDAWNTLEFDFGALWQMGEFVFERSIKWDPTGPGGVLKFTGKIAEDNFNYSPAGFRTWIYEYSSDVDEATFEGGTVTTESSTSEQGGLMGWFNDLNPVEQVIVVVVVVIVVIVAIELAIVVATGEITLVAVGGSIAQTMGTTYGMSAAMLMGLAGAAMFYNIMFMQGSDSDGVKDSEELNAGISPLYWDTDGDGLSDGYEKSLGSDDASNSAVSTYGFETESHPADWDFIADTTGLWTQSTTQRQFGGYSLKGEGSAGNKNYQSILFNDEMNDGSIEAWTYTQSSNYGYPSIYLRGNDPDPSSSGTNIKNGYFLFGYVNKWSIRSSTSGSITQLTPSGQEYNTGYISSQWWHIKFEIIDNKAKAWVSSTDTFSTKPQLEVDLGSSPIHTTGKAGISSKLNMGSSYDSYWDQITTKELYSEIYDFKYGIPSTSEWDYAEENVWDVRTNGRGGGKALGSDLTSLTSKTRTAVTMGNFYADSYIDGWGYSSSSTNRIGFNIQAVDNDGTGSSGTINMGYLAEIYSTTFKLYRIEDYSYTEIYSYNLGKNMGGIWWHVRLQMVGNTIYGWISETDEFSQWEQLQYDTSSDLVRYKGGKPGLSMKAGWLTSVVFDDIEFGPISHNIISSTALPNGELLGAAKWTPDGVLLTSLNNSMNGQLNMELNTGEGDIDAYFVFEGAPQFGTSGADGFYFYAYKGTAPTTNGDTQAGYLIAWDTFTDQVYVKFGGTTIHTFPAPYELSEPKVHSVRVIIDFQGASGTNIQVYVDQYKLIDEMDIDRAMTGHMMGIGAETGGWRARHILLDWRISGYAPTKAVILGEYDLQGDVLDDSGNNNYGVIYGGGLSYNQYSAVKAADFDGVNDYVSLPESLKDDHSDVLNTGSVSAWIKSTDTSGVILASGSTTTSGLYFMLMLNGGSVGFYHNRPGIGGQYQFGNVGYNLDDGRWHYIVWQSDGYEWSVYADGHRLDDSIWNPSYSGLWLGDFGDTLSLGVLDRQSNYGYYDGEIYDVAISQGILSNTEILTNYYFGLNELYVDNKAGFIEDFDYTNTGWDSSGSSSGLLWDQSNELMNGVHDYANSNWEYSYLKRDMQMSAELGTIVDIDFQYNFPKMGQIGYRMYDAIGNIVFAFRLRDFQASSTGPKALIRAWSPSSTYVLYYESGYQPNSGAGNIRIEFNSPSSFDIDISWNGGSFQSSVSGARVAAESLFMIGAASSIWMGTGTVWAYENYYERHTYPKYLLY